MGDKVEVKGEHGKCSCLLYLTKKDGELHYSRCTKTVEYQPETRVFGMTMYPIVNLIWNRAHNSARGVGEVFPLIPNQIESNKILYRRLESMKMMAFPKPVYVDGMRENPENLSEAGSAIRIREGSVQRVNDYIMFLQPSGMSAEVNNMQGEMIDRTRDLANAGDTAMGNINPEQASGAAIAAVRDAQAVPLNEVQNALKQMVEDIGRLWLDMLCAYSPNGITFKGEVVAAPEDVRRMKLQVRIDVSPRDPWSKYSQEQVLAALHQSGAITFEEYVEALDDDSNTPKGKLQAILNKRKEAGQNGMLQGGNESAGAPAGEWAGVPAVGMPGM